MAEGVGFEPTIRLPVYTLSKRAPSATRPSLRRAGARRTIDAETAGASGFMIGSGMRRYERSTVVMPHSLCFCSEGPRADRPWDPKDLDQPMLAFFRFLAAAFLLIAVFAGVYDGTRTLAADRLVTTSLLEHWSTLAPTLLNTTQSAVKRSTPPLVWDLGLGKALLLPAPLVFFAIGVLFAYIGRRRRRVNVFAN